jgi:AraC-like DNA-binding protein
MDTNTSMLRGLVPAVCDAEAGLPAETLRSIVTELHAAIRSALDEERSAAQISLRRASQMLEQIRLPDGVSHEAVSGGLCKWQIRKVADYVATHMHRPIRNEELAALARLTPAHFGRAFRNSTGEPPHEYVIRRRIERARDLMLSTDAPLSDIAQECGLADQSHLTRLFRRLVGESPRAWRRARASAPESSGA